MIEPLLITYIQKEAIFKLKKKIKRKEIKNLLEEYYKIPQLGKNKIVYDYIFLGSSNMKASSVYYHIITVSGGWAKQLILENNKDVKNAFLMTIGHELAHKNGDFRVNYLKTNKIERKFVNWVTEVHHDFYASKIMANYSRLKLIEAIQYKITLKPNNIDGKTHPSWKKRLKYVSNYDFDESLIRKIADDVGCQNEELIKEISAYYDPIKLI